MVFLALSDDCRWRWVCWWTWQTLHAFMTATTSRKKASNMWSFTVKGMSSSPSTYAGARAIPMCSNSSVAHCFSHGECPSADTTAMFIRLCEHFIERNPTELIGESLFLVLQFSGSNAGSQRSGQSVTASSESPLNGPHKHPFSSFHWLQFPPEDRYLFTIQTYYERLFFIPMTHLYKFIYICLISVWVSSLHMSESYRYYIIFRPSFQ